MAFFRVFLLLSVCVLSIASASILSRRDNDTMVYSFDQITPSANLSWTACFSSFTCANLEVPLDYEDLSAGTTNVAFIKKASSNSTATDIIINPGGPSNSGVYFFIEAALLLEQMFGSQYNLISWDPRGVNNSGPALTCFPESEAAQDVFGRTLGLPVDANSSAGLVEAFQYAGGWGQWCSRATTAQNAQYANTPAVAADLLRFIELRSEECGGNAADAKLWYYGLSYGAVIGTTFASLYPDKVGRMILDAPWDMEDYYSGQSRENLHDADAAVQSFFTYCYEAGKENCAFYANSSAAVEARFTKVIQDLQTDPIVVTDPFFVQMPTLATYTTLQSFILQATFAPITRFPTFAQLMVLLENRNGSAIAQNSGFGTLTTQCAGEPQPKGYHMEEPRLIILCNDANGRSNLSTVEKFTEQVDYLTNQSYYLGASWAGATYFNCRSLDIRPPKSQQFNGLPSANTTSSPILFVSTTIDPTSSLRGAQKMASLFPGSALLTVEGVGHGSVTVPSNCTVEHMQAYLATGTVEVNVTCTSDSVPFVGSDGGWGKALHAVY